MSGDALGFMYSSSLASAPTSAPRSTSARAASGVEAKCSAVRPCSFLKLTSALPSSTSALTLAALPASAALMSAVLEPFG